MVMPFSSRSFNSISSMVDRLQASIMLVGSSAMSTLGCIMKMRAIISRCICPPESSKGYLLYSSSYFRFTNLHASTIICRFSSRLRWPSPFSVRQSFNIFSTRKNWLKVEKGSWKMA